MKCLIYQTNMVSSTVLDVVSHTPVASSPIDHPSMPLKHVPLGSSHCRITLTLVQWTFLFGW